MPRSGDDDSDPPFIVAGISGVVWGGIIGGIASGRRDIDNSLILSACVCCVSVTMLCLVLTARSGLLAVIGQLALRVGAALLAFGSLAGLLLLIAVPLQLVAKLAFMEAYERRFPISSQWILEQVVIVIGLGLIGYLGRKRLGSVLLVGFVATLFYGFPLIASVTALLVMSIPALLLVGGWLWIAGTWPSGEPGFVLGAFLGGATGAAHGIVMSVFTAAWVELDLFDS